jgi:hypothetical protein
MRSAGSENTHRKAGDTRRINRDERSCFVAVDVMHELVRTARGPVRWEAMKDILGRMSHNRGEIVNILTNY